MTGLLAADPLFNDGIDLTVVLIVIVKTIIVFAILLISVIFVLANLVVDIIYTFLDPRIRYD